MPRLHAHRYLRRELAALRRSGAATVAFEPGAELLSVMGVNPLRGARIDEIEQMSYEQACAHLDAAPDITALFGPAAATAAG
ncbi:MAG: hypothetical protein JO222_09985 [Frankiales bacterium]|nr:hypothetical protein [Frankiales bacterium]